MKLRDLIRCTAMFGATGILSANPAGPYAFTQPHWAVTSTLNGIAGPNGLPSRAWFEWGATTNYGQITSPTSLEASTGVKRMSAMVSNLVTGEIYHARLVVSNAAGVAFGMDQPLITPGRMKLALLGSGYCSSFPLPIPHNPCFPPCANNDGHPSPPPLGPPLVSDIVGISPSGLVLRSDGVAFRRGMSVFSNVVAVAGANPDLGLHSDGTIVASDGNVPAAIHDVIAIARGGRYSLVLSRDGTVAAWGDPTGPNLATNVPPGLSNVVAISTGPEHALALCIDGTVVAWGHNGSGQTDVPPRLMNVVAIAAGPYSSVAVRRDGTVIAWPDTSLNLVRNLSNVVAMAIGETSLALHEDGTITETGSTWGTPWRRKLFSNVVEICDGFALAPNQAPLGYSTSVVGAPDNDSVIYLYAFDANGDIPRLHIASLPSAGTLYQFENGGRSAPILTPQTLVTDSERRVIFAPEPQSAGLDSSFTFVADDGELESSPIRVAISLPPTFPRIRIHPLNPCSATLRFVGNTNQTYRVWSSTNLLDWQVLGWALAWGSSAFDFTDYQTKVPARFYKVSTP